MKLKETSLPLIVIIIIFAGCKGDVGPVGINSLVLATEEPQGANCPSGGQKIEIGLDTNRDGVLEPTEVQSTQYLCNGANGLPSLIKTSIELPGQNCPSGGQKIEIGLDTNRDGVLEPTEVQSTQYLCNGANGLPSLIKTSIELPGQNCQSGGDKIETGIDLNKNGILDPGEVQQTVFACNGTNGLPSLIKISIELPGQNCQSGGDKIETGIDLNKNGILDASEVQQTVFACDGTNGLTSLIKTSIELPGQNCQSGGDKIETGIDLNKNGILDPSEVQQTVYACNGANGLTSLIKTSIELPGQNCQSGGDKIEAGIDLNENGVLDPSEVQQTVFACNGANGTTIDQIRFQVFNGAGYDQTTPFIYKGLLKFNISDYPEMDSVIFLVEDAMTSNSDSKIIFGLYDLNNQVPILNSKLETSSTVNTRLVSGNIRQSFPQSEIDIGLSVGSEINGTYGAENGGAFIFLYRRK